MCVLLTKLYILLLVIQYSQFEMFDLLKLRVKIYYCGNHILIIGEGELYFMVARM
jgi:voltage-gated potassium channel Kch